jgi:TDG/mug DNA glycosylase family protein
VVFGFKVELSARASNSANELSKEEYIEGGKVLEAKVLKYKPQWVAFVGVQAYRAAFARPKAQVGEQNKTIGESKIWVLPSPSGLNARYRPAEFSAVFRELYMRVNE